MVAVSLKKNIKIATDDLARKELEDNLDGYRKIRRLGLPEFIPRINYTFLNLEYSYILMEDLGPDFIARSRSEINPIRLYRELIGDLTKIYRTTRHKCDRSMESIAQAVALAHDQYQKYLDFMDTGNLNPLFEKLAQDVLRLTPRYATFSSWDFTPENVYLTKSGTRYVDPHTEVIGMPIIDLACFAGTARDAHNLPDSAWGYTLLKSFALIEVANLMQITAAEAEKIFRIGRILQCIMSSIVRVNTDEQHATQLFHQASYHLARCME